MSDETFMIRMRIALQKLIDLGNRRLVPFDEAFDFGYLAHLMVCELFASKAPKPFAVTTIAEPYVTILGYSRSSREELVSQAEMFADPGVFCSVDWERFDVKKMPSSWQEGKRADFELTALPTIRYMDPDSKRNVEQDIFLYELKYAKLEKRSFVRRYDVYMNWVKDQLNLAGGTRLTNCYVTRAYKKKLVRSTHWSQQDRPKYRFITRSVSETVGSLIITDSEKFSLLIRNGIGFHRTFGFGMIRLCAPGTHF